MRIRVLANTLVGVGLMSGLVLAGKKPPKNLLPDPGFKKADFAPLAKKSTWLNYAIVLPSEAKVDKNKGVVTLKGGKTFLHSSVFAVQPGQSYRISVKARGTGKISIECLWWVKYGDDTIGLAKPHRTIAVKPVALKKLDKPKQIIGTDTAPKGGKSGKAAKKAYIRIVVEDGTISISEPTVTIAPKTPKTKPARK